MNDASRKQLSLMETILHYTIADMSHKKDPAIYERRDIGYFLIGGAFRICGSAIALNAAYMFLTGDSLATSPVPSDGTLLAAASVSIMCYLGGRRAQRSQKKP